jgi:hypothetical protein
MRKARSLLPLLAAFLALPATALGASGRPFRWSAPAAIDPAPFTTTHDLTAMSCPSSSLCIAGDDHGDLLGSNNPAGGASAWTATRNVDPPGPIAGVSCPSASFCVAVGARGDILTSTRPLGGIAGWKRIAGVVSKSIGFGDVSCASSRLCVALDGAGDVVTSTRPAGGRSRWKVADVIPPVRHDPLASVSCPSARLCLAVDATGRYVARSTRPARGAHAWRMTKLGTPRQSRDSPPGIGCASPKLCVIAGTDKNPGNAFVVSSTHPTGGTAAWKVARHVPAATGSLSSVSCPSTNLCVADGDAFVGSVVYSTDPTGGGRAWKATVKPRFEDQGGTGVSCASVKLCLLFDSAVGDVLTSRTPTVLGSWTRATVDSLNELDAINCLNAGFCAAGGTGGRVLTSTNPTGGPGAWSAATINLSPTTIACPSTGLCVATGIGGSEGLNIAVSTNPSAGASSWQYAETAMNEPGPASNGGLSCPSVSLCVVPAYQVESDSDVEATSLLTSTNPGGGTGAWTLSDRDIDGGINGGRKPGDGDVVAISCASTTLCAGVDDGGRVLASGTPLDAASWTRRSVDGKNVFTGISCPAANLCVAIDAAGHVVTSAGPLSGPWKVAEIDPASGLSAVSCASASMCVAVDGVQNAFVSTNPTGGASAWRRTGGIDPGLTAISCPTAALCVAVDDDGNAITGTP